MAGTSSLQKSAKLLKFNKQPAGNSAPVVYFFAEKIGCFSLRIREIKRERTFEQQKAERKRTDERIYKAIKNGKQISPVGSHRQFSGWPD